MLTFVLNNVVFSWDSLCLARFAHKVSLENLGSIILHRKLYLEYPPSLHIRHYLQHGWISFVLL